MLYQGSSGAEVALLQQFLNNQSGSTHGIQIDGIFGHATEQAVKNFQINMGLNPDGIVGPNTMAVMENLGYLTGG